MTERNAKDDDASGSPEGGGDGVPAAAGLRSFTAGDREWVVLDGGQSLTGTGHLAPAALRLIQFAHADAPDTPLLEVTVPPGSLDDLHDAELIELMKSARNVPVYAPPGEPGVEDRRLRTGGAQGRDRNDSRRRR